MTDWHRVVLAYKQGGFQEIGGLKRIAEEAVTHLRCENTTMQIGTLCIAETGVLAGTIRVRRLKRGDHLVVVGCNSPWAYALAIWARLNRHPVSWMPSLHDPAYAIHRTKAKLAQTILRWLQLIGVVVYAQTVHEVRLLSLTSANQCKLSGHGLPKALRNGFRHDQLANPNTRPIDLLFLGRPTAQKGWQKFIELVHQSGLAAEAVVPFTPKDSAGMPLHLAVSDADVQELLKASKLLIVPANYESIGIAQLEGVLAGCVVPILGHWPLWSGFEHLQWARFKPDALAHACQELCQNKAERDRLVREQHRWIQQHPIMTSPVLPGL